MQQQTNQQLYPSNQNAQDQLQQHLSFRSIPFTLALNSKSIQFRQQISQLSSSNLFDTSAFLQTYQISYAHLSDYSHYLDFQLGRVGLVKLLLRQTITYYEPVLAQPFFQQKEISMLIFLINTIQYQQILEIIQAFDLQCEHYTPQKQFSLRNKVIKLKQMLPMHMESLERKKKVYLSKFTKINALYANQLKNRISYLLSVLQSKYQSKQKATLNQILSSIERFSFPSIQSLLNLFEAILLEIKSRAQKLISQPIDEKQLKSLYIYEYLLKSYLQLDRVPYNERSYLKNTREKIMNTQKRVMLEELFGPREPLQQKQNIEDLESF